MYNLANHKIKLLILTFAIINGCLLGAQDQAPNPEHVLEPAVQVAPIVVHRPPFLIREYRRIALAIRGREEALIRTCIFGAGAAIATVFWATLPPESINNLHDLERCPYITHTCLEMARNCFQK